MSTAMELAKLPRKDLEATALKLGIKALPKDDSMLIRAIEKAVISRQIQIEQEARADAKQAGEKLLGFKVGDKMRRPSVQDVAIKFSKKVIAEFKNLENPSDENGDGADVEFIVGSSFFHLYDGHRFVMPECMVTDEPLKDKALLDKLQKFWVSTGMAAERARKQAVFDLLTISMPRRCVYPTFKWIEDSQGRSKQVLDRNHPRFMFIIHGDAPEGAEIGDLMDPEEVSVDDEIAEAMKME